MKKQIITLVTVLMAAAIGAQAQSRLEPMTQIEQELWGEKEFGTWLSERAIQQMLIFPSFSFPSAAQDASARTRKDSVPPVTSVIAGRMTAANSSRTERRSS